MVLGLQNPGPSAPLRASYLAGAERAERVIVRSPASPVRALLPLEEAGVGVSKPTGATWFGWRWGVWARHSGQWGHHGRHGLQSPRRLYFFVPCCCQAQAAHLALVGNVQLRGETG